MKGFSLIELVTVMVIVGIVALFAAPRFFSTNPFSERGFYEDALAAVRYTQKFAIASRCTVTASFTAGTGPAGSYTLTYNSCPDGSSGTVQRPGDGNFTNTAPAGVAVSASPSSVSFDRIGRPSAATTITVGSRSLQVEAETGFVH